MGRLFNTAYDADAKEIPSSAIVLIIRRHTTSVAEDTSPLTLPDVIDTERVGADIVELPTTGDARRLIREQLSPGKQSVFVDSRGQAFDVGYRFQLPHEENFPEFEPPTQ